MSPGALFHKYRLPIIAVIGSLTLHGALLFAGSYKGTYDAYVHIFFADHYARSWWDLWETRWYTGFTMASYPPLTHQLIALISKVSSLPTGFILVMLFSAVATTIGVYRFSLLWVNPRAAGYAALLATFSSSIAETIHVFGQLPTMFVMGIMLNALPYVWYWLEHGKLSDLLRAWAMLMIAAAGHHVTTLFGMIFFSGPVILAVLVMKFRTPLADEITYEGRIRLSMLRGLITHRVRRVWGMLVRSGIFGVGLIAVLVITVLPYWLWSKSDPITQITIPHASRDSFLQNTPAGLIFFVVPWGVLSLTFPYALYKGFSSKNWMLAGSLAVMAVFGTGGTTPIPALILRGAYYILTLDRFTFWATIIILPFSGLFIESMTDGRLGQWIAARIGDWWRAGILIVFGLTLVAFALFTATLTQYRKFEPAPIDMQPIIEFLAKDNHDEWRYLTLGFGDQMAWLSAQTTALDVEGNYHSARRLPEMTSTPVERLDGAKYTNIPGLGSLQQFVTNPERYNLKYIFVADAFYEPLLFFAGWEKLGSLDNHIEVWQRADVPPLPTTLPAVQYPFWERLMWGTLPVGSIFITLFVFAITALWRRRDWQVQNIPLLRRIVRWRLMQSFLWDAPRTEAPPHFDWQFWKRYTRRIFPEINLRPYRWRRVYGVGLLIFLVIAAGGAYLFIRKQVFTPDAAILAYYDDLDFKKYTDSYTYLNTSDTQQGYLRWLSLQGGILASFAKLENLYTTDTPIDASHVKVHVEADWLTALGTYKVPNDYTMTLVNGKWKIDFDETIPPEPRDTLITQPSTLSYLDTPLTTLDNTALTRGVLDRSLLSVGALNTVFEPDAPVSFAPEAYDAGRIKGRFVGVVSVLGVVTNKDHYPAQVTISALLRDKDGNRLAEESVMDVVLHQLLPGESSPFRIDFNGYDASQIIDINKVASVEVTVEGVPTAFNLARPLVEVAPDTLYNSGAAAVDVPQVLTTVKDKAGKLIWVDSTYLSVGIKPDETASYSANPLPDGLRELGIPATVSGPRLTDWTGSIPATVINGYSR